MANINSPVTSQQRQAIKGHLDRLKHLCQSIPNQAIILQSLDGLEDALLREAPDGAQDLAAQVSLYPLRQSALSPTIDEALSILANYGLRVVPGAMSSMISGQPATLWAALQAVYTRAAAKGDVVMIVTLSNACPSPEIEEK
jgi:uncharacterized protein YqgV (UPF0045/DUF77 family)